MNMALQNFSQQWNNNIVAYLSVPKNESEYYRQQEWIDELLDEIGEDEFHPLESLLNTLGTLSHAYELDKYAEPQATASEVLHFLIQEHGLKQNDLSEIGSQGVVSEILNGKRQLNVRQIRQLSQRFHVSPAVFI